jgi:HPt (histidine-containing phosphotransfer) domain-containing protein
MTDPIPAQSPLDMQVIASLKELGGEDDANLFFELVDLFLQDSRAHIGALERALEQNDVRSLERVAHTLKSSSANLGATNLSRLCFELEQRGRAGQMLGAGELLARAKTEYVHVKRALEQVKS